MQLHFLSGDHQREHKAALIEGLQRHNALHLGPNVTACWGWRTGQRFRKLGREVLVLERGYLADRYAYTSIAWNGLNGYARFPAYPDDGGERFRSLGVELKAWNPEGDSVLLIGQVRGDMSLKGHSLAGWYENTARQASRVYGLPVRFRPHPMERGQRTTVAGFETDRGPLSVALERAHVVITYNSNTAVESVLAGKQTVCCDPGAMAWPVTAHALGKPFPRGRAVWAYALAWKQWRLDEIRTGDALVGVVDELRRGALCYG